MYLKLNIFDLNIKIKRLKKRYECTKGKLRIEANWACAPVVINTNK